MSISLEIKAVTKKKNQYTAALMTTIIHVEMKALFAHEYKMAWRGHTSRF